MAKLNGAKIGSRAVRCGWAHHKKDAMQSIDYATVDQVLDGGYFGLVMHLISRLVPSKCFMVMHSVAVLGRLACMYMQSSASSNGSIVQ